MKSLARSDHRPVASLGGRRPTQAGIQTQWNMNFTAIPKKDDQPIVLKPQSLGAVSGDVDGASAHASFPEYRHGIVSATTAEGRVRSLKIRHDRCIRR
jgi:hypothetical protein